MPLAEQNSTIITLHDELITDYVLDTDIIVDGRRDHRTIVFDEESTPVPSHIRPALVPGTRVYMDSEGAACLCPPLGEPMLERRPGTIVVRRIRRKVAVAGDLTLLWSLLQFMDGLHTAAELLSELPKSSCHAGVQLLSKLGAVGVVDISDRPIGRFIHAVTKKGVLPGGELDVADVLRLVTDGDYRAYPQAARLPVRCEVPEALGYLHKIIRTRRSYQDYNGTAIKQADFETLLTIACGVTGRLKWTDREVKLRAYPSSGGLYAVEIYPVVFAIEGMGPGVYHYRPTESILEVVCSNIRRELFLNAVLPSGREMLRGVAVMICLAGVFGRHERKYGEGGYRMLVAEAGHISQNLLLTSTALGLHARPFGGVFDELLNRMLGFETDEEQFLLSVIIGYAGDNQ